MAYLYLLFIFGNFSIDWVTTITVWYTRATTTKFYF